MKRKRSLSSRYFQQCTKVVKRVVLKSLQEKQRYGMTIDRTKTVDHNVLEI